MGFAKAAELNHYPGPKHVLQLADQLQLSEEQRQKRQRVFDEMNSKAINLGKRLSRKSICWIRALLQQTFRMLSYYISYRKFQTFKEKSERHIYRRTLPREPC